MSVSRMDEINERLEFIDKRLSGEITASEESLREFRIERGRLIEEMQELKANPVIEELPPEGVIPEQILETINGIALENYTAYPTLIREEVETIIGVRDLIAKEAHDETKRLLKIEQGLVRDLLERNGRIEQDYQAVIESENELQIELNEANLRAVDFESKHKAATDRILELEDELREALAIVNRNKEFKALTEAERTAEAEAERQRFLDSRVKIYNPRDADEIDKRECIANLAETGEEVRYKRIYEASYTIITEEEAINIQAMNKPLEIPELMVTEEEIFQEDASTESAQDTDESTDSGEQREAVEVESETFLERRQTDYVTRDEYQTLRTMVIGLNEIIYDRLGERYDDRQVIDIAS